MIPSFFKVSVQRFLWLLVAYSVVRALFLLWNWNTFAADSGSEIVWAFLLGLRFDTSAILLTNALSFLLWMLPTRWLARIWMRRLDLTWFALVNFICLGLGFVDAEFVKFLGKRTSFDLLFIRQDVEQQSLSILFTYWYFVAGLTFVLALLMWLVPRFSQSSSREGAWPGAAWRLIGLGLIFTGMRGGCGYKPINPMDAYFNTRHELGLLTLNTPLNVIKTTPNAAVERARYFNNDRDAIVILQNANLLSRPPLGVARGWNVVLLIIESFGTEYTGIGNHYPGYTPFFDSLAKQGFYFNLNFANARRSLEGLPAILCGIPAIMQEPVITSDFSSNRLDCLPKILAGQGYSTYFLHGAHNGSMHFDSFSRLAGFENFVGLNEFPAAGPQDLDTHWGVLDEPMLQYAVKVIDKAKPPVLLGLFTLSSHHPYYIPPQYRGRFPKGTLEIHESIGYADYALQQFFKTAATKPWFNHTVFVLTADHTQKSDHKEYQDLIGAWRVPLLIYIPGLKTKPAMDLNRITQQIDIQPTILDLLGLDPLDPLLVGKSVFDLGRSGQAFNFTSHSYWYLDHDVLLDFGRPPSPLYAFSHHNSWGAQLIPNSDPRVAQPLEKLKAAVHYLNQGLLGNSLYKWRSSL